MLPIFLEKNQYKSTKDDDDKGVDATYPCDYSEKQDQTGLDRSARSTLDFGAKGLKVSRSQGLKL